jgi:transposase
MRGDHEEQAPMWSYISPEQRIPPDHPLRPLRTLVDAVLKELSPRFSRLYAKTGRPSVAPERLLRALLLQVLYSIRSERQLMEQLDYNLLYRWFVGLNLDDPIWDVSVFTKNRQRLLDGEVAEAFFDAVLAQARDRQLLSNEHFTVDGTLIQAWAGLKSFQRKDVPPTPPDDPGNPTVNFHGERRSNATHQSTTDPDARLFRKGGAQEARLYYQGHVLMDHRHGLAVGGRLTSAGASAERDAAIVLAAGAIPRARATIAVGGQLTAAGASAERDAAVVLAAGAIGRARATLAADKAYDTRDFVATLRALGVTPHLAQNTTKRRSAIDARTTRHPGYALSQRTRKRVEEIFGWLKTVALLRQTRHRGRARVGWMFLFGLAAYNLLRIRNLTWAAA